MKDEVEKLLKLIYGPDVVDDAYASPAGKITKKNARIELLTLIEKAQVEAVRAELQLAHHNIFTDMGVLDEAQIDHYLLERLAELTKEDGETK